MNRMFKTLLLWIIMIALPIQATAAVMKASCGSSHSAMQEHGIVYHHTAPAQAHQAHQEFRQQDGHDAMPASHGHSDHAVHAPHAADSADPADEILSKADADQSAGHNDHSSCSACAACYVGAAAPPSAHMKTPEFSNFVKSTLAATSLLAGFIPAGLERPPRLFFA